MESFSPVVLQTIPSVIARIMEDVMTSVSSCRDRTSVNAHKDTGWMRTANDVTVKLSCNLMCGQIIGVNCDNLCSLTVCRDRRMC